MTERQALFDAIFICGVHSCGAAETAPAFRILTLQQVPLAGLRTQDFSTSGNLEPLGRGLLGFNAFWTSHKSDKFFSKRARNIGNPRNGSKGEIEEISAEDRRMRPARGDQAKYPACRANHGQP